MPSVIHSGIHHENKFNVDNPRKMTLKAIQKKKQNLLVHWSWNTIDRETGDGNMLCNLQEITRKLNNRQASKVLLIPQSNQNSHHKLIIEASRKYNSVHWIRHENIINFLVTFFIWKTNNQSTMLSWRDLFNPIIWEVNSKPCQQLRSVLTD